MSLIPAKNLFSWNIFARSSSSRQINLSLYWRKIIKNQ